MNAVGIDVSKGKSTVAVLRPFGEIVAEPFDVVHECSDLNKLADFIKSLPGETKAVPAITICPSQMRCITTVYLFP